MQPHHLVIEMAEHALHLVIAPFDDRQPRLARPEDVQLGGQGGEVFEGEVEAFEKLGHIVLANLVLGFHQIVFGQLGRGLGKPP